MSHISEVQSNGQPKNTRLLKVTPEDLRVIADRLEAVERAGTVPGEAILYPLCSWLTVVYQPQINVRKLDVATEDDEILPELPRLQ